jgi:hypothetical protein
LYESIPTAHPITKGVVLLVALWVVFGFLVPLIMGAGAGLSTGITVASVVTSLVDAIISGVVLGFAYEWVTRRAPAVVKTT